MEEAEGRWRDVSVEKRKGGESEDRIIGTRMEVQKE